MWNCLLFFTFKSFLLDSKILKEDFFSAITTTTIVIVAVVINKNTAAVEVRVPVGTLQRRWWPKDVLSRAVCQSNWLAWSKDEQPACHTAPLNNWLTLPRFHSELTPSTKNAFYVGLRNPEQQHSTFNLRSISIIFFLFSYGHKLFGFRPSNNCSRGCNTLYMARQIFIHLGIFDLCILGLWPTSQLWLTNY